MGKEKRYNRQYFERKFTRRDPWNFWDSTYEQTKYQRQLVFIKKYHPFPTQILEIGCSEGAFTKILRDSFPRTRITGVDISTRAIQVGKEKVKDVTFIVGNILKIADKLPKNNFDVIVMSETIYYLGTNINFVKMYTFLKKLKGSLKRKGILITANIVDCSDTPGMLIAKQPIIESYYTLLSGLLVLIEKRNYKDYKKKERQKFNYGIRIFKKI